jgi:hypothetical protein
MRGNRFAPFATIFARYLAETLAMAVLALMAHKATMLPIAMLLAFVVGIYAVPIGLALMRTNPVLGAVAAAAGWALLAGGIGAILGVALHDLAANVDSLANRRRLLTDYQGVIVAAGLAAAAIAFLHRKAMTMYSPAETP